MTEITQNAEVKTQKELKKSEGDLEKDMNSNQNKQQFPVLNLIISVFVKVILLLGVLCLFILVYVYGLIQGYELASRNAEASITQILSDYANKINVSNTTPSITPTPSIVKLVAPKKVTWGGPDLWEAVNKRRVQLGVNPLSTRSELCTIASIRLNELLDLGKLDGHEGFSNMKERRPDVKWIFDKYGTVAEFLAMGGESASETVQLWENTLGHSQLLKGGEYVWGCIYAQDSFAVAITAF